MEGGNLGAPPKPPRTGSYSRGQRDHRGLAGGGQALGRGGPRVVPGRARHCDSGHSAARPAAAPPPPRSRRSAWPTARPARRRSCWAWLMTASRSSRQALATPRVSRWKYVTGEVGAAVEGLPVRGHEHRHGPSALARHGLGGGHVDGVDIRAFLTIHLDRHEMLVHDGGNLLILERLVCHHVAPVAGGVADRQQHRHIALGRRLERCLGPRPPVHRVASVLKEVRARRMSETVCHVSII